MNVFTFSGHLGNDAQQRFTQSGDSIVSFSVPVKAGFGDKAKTTWIKCSLWGKRGESVLPYLLKSQHVAVTGEFSLEEWTGKEGDKRVDASVRVNDVELLGKRTDGDRQPERSQSAPQQRSTMIKGSSFDDDSDSIPF